jgi:hypothetical protein
MSNEDGNCFQSADVMLKVALQPLHTSQPLDAVKQQLNNMLFKFNKSVDGIPLSYSELSFPKGKEYARIIADQFWLHVDVCTKLLIFKPVMGQSIRGKVNKVSVYVLIAACARSLSPVDARACPGRIFIDAAGCREPRVHLDTSALQRDVK